MSFLDGAKDGKQKKGPWKMRDRVNRQHRQERNFKPKEYYVEIARERVADAVARQKAKIAEGACPSVLSRLARRVRDLKEELRHWEIT